MILSSILTTGQLTFIIRVAIQILSYGGPALIGLIILGSVPRLAPVDTHDTINRVVGASTAMFSISKWIWKHARQNPIDPTPPTKLTFILALSIIYTLFVSLSDIGLLGFHACSIPGPSMLDFPASITSDDAARSFIIHTNLVNGTDLAKINAWRCDSSSPSPAIGNLYNCTSWRNSTYADPTLFTGINSSDSDVLLARQLARSLDTAYDINAIYLGPDAQRLLSPTISNGLAINPHPTGVQIIMGVPQLSPSKAVVIPQTMAIEVEFGCMELGLVTIRQTQETTTFDYFLTGQNSWGRYVGPDNLHDVLFQSTIETRAYLRPLFNISTQSDDTSTQSDGSFQSFNESLNSDLLSRSAKVSQFQLPVSFDSLEDPSLSFLGNCTARLQNKLRLTPMFVKDNLTHEFNFPPPHMCGYYGVGASIQTNGSIGLAFAGMICASTTQVNMVSSTISTSPTNTTNITSISRLPSTLNYLRADFFSESVLKSGHHAGAELFTTYSPYERYTLTPSPNGTTSHMVYPGPGNLDNTLSLDAPGSGGTFISTLSAGFFDTDITLSSYASLLPLSSGFQPMSNVSPAVVTEWSGQFGGSVTIASITYNAWAARQIPPLLVTSLDGSLGTCYNPIYALGFLPLALATIVILVWTIVSLFQGNLFGTKQVKIVYGGLGPQVRPQFSQEVSRDELLVWEKDGDPSLWRIEDGYPVTGHPSDTLLRFLKLKGHTD